jgi:hypothetical protein
VSSEPDRHTARPDPAHVAIEERKIDWAELENIVHRDPVARGLAGYSPAGAPLDAGQMRAAATDLALRADTVGIVTGFCSVLQDEVTAETDGPPGALFLARALAACGIDVVLITDRYALPLLEAGRGLWKLDRTLLCEFPFEDGQTSRASNDALHNTTSDRWTRDFFVRFAARDSARPLSHLISIERPGPSHTLDSLRAQGANESTLAQFEHDVPAASRNVSHTMRGKSINRWTAKTHRLFEWIGEQQLGVTTIGIGDGGNELGMGHFAWELLNAATSGPAGQIACRVATDYALIAGVSDWAAYCLALTVARLRGEGYSARDWHARGQRELIETIVRQTSAVDGVTLRHEPTVDGLKLDVYLEPLVATRRSLGYDAGER